MRIRRSKLIFRRLSITPSVLVISFVSGRSGKFLETLPAALSFANLSVDNCKPAPYPYGVSAMPVTEEKKLPIWETSPLLSDEVPRLPFWRMLPGG